MPIQVEFTDKYDNVKSVSNPQIPICCTCSFLLLAAVMSLAFSSSMYAKRLCN